jgi:hypothetical protein
MPVPGARAQLITPLRTSLKGTFAPHWIGRLVQTLMSVKIMNVKNVKPFFYFLTSYLSSPSGAVLQKIIGVGYHLRILHSK